MWRDRWTHHRCLGLLQPLLALLASCRPRPQSRDKLVAWLWPERDVERARNLLNQGVHALRMAVGQGGIVSVQDEEATGAGRRSV